METTLGQNEPTPLQRKLLDGVVEVIDELANELVGKIEPFINNNKISDEGKQLLRTHCKTNTIFIKIHKKIYIYIK